MSLREEQLLALGRRLQAEGYRFVTVTPETHAFVNARVAADADVDLRHIFGWNRPFRREQLRADLFDLVSEADVCRELDDGRWQTTIRFSSMNEQLFAHSGFPTSAADSVFFGPDSYRFVRGILPLLPQQGRLVDVGCGSGVGGILAAKHAPGLELVLCDINPAALKMARVNAALAGVRASVVHSDVLAGVSGVVDIIISNPPYMADAEHRTYRDGGGQHGTALSIRIVDQALERLGRSPRGGTLLMYTGSAVARGGRDRFLEQVQPMLRRRATDFSYEELDPDVFPAQLAEPGYADVERIAVVLLQAHVA